MWGWEGIADVKNKIWGAQWSGRVEWGLNYLGTKKGAMWWGHWQF